MGRTIIQPIGPLYGEAVNGTVFGRPNGSIYIPETNQISLELSTEYVKNWIGVGNPPYVIASTNSTGTSVDNYHVVAKSQDVASYIRIEIAPTSDFEAEDTAYFNHSAGLFNVTGKQLANKNYYAIENATTYYVRALLVANSGVSVATSDIVTVTGVASE